MYVRKNNNERSQSLSPDQIRSTVAYLNRHFRETADSLKARLGSHSNVKGSELHDFQVDFAYLIDEIQRGPLFFAVQRITEANDLIAQMSKVQKG